MKRKKNKVIYWIVGIIALIIVLNQFGILKFNELALVTGEDNVPYTCPSDKTSCTVDAILDCYTPVNPGSTELWECSYPYSSLTGCTKATASSLTGCQALKLKCNNGAGVDCSKDIRYCNQVAIPEKYECTGTYKKTSKSGQVTTRTISYPSQLVGGSAKYNEVINSGDRVEVVNLVNADGFRIDYQTYFQRQCEVNECYGDGGFWECSSEGVLLKGVNKQCTDGKICVGAPNLPTVSASCQYPRQCYANECNSERTGWSSCNPTTHQLEGYVDCAKDYLVCKNAQCVSPFETPDFKFLVNGIETTKKTVGIKKTDTISVRYKFYSSELSSSVPIIFKVFKGENTFISSVQDTYNPQSGTYQAKDIIPTPSEGYYNLMIYAVINGKEVPLVTKSEYLFNVGNPLELSVQVKSEAGSVLVSGKPLDILIKPTDLNGAPVEVDRNWAGIKIYFNDKLQSIPSPKSDSFGNPLFENGMYTITYVNPPSGTIKVDATVYKNNVPSNNYVETYNIVSPKLTVWVDNQNVLGQIPPGKTVTIYFTVKDRADIPQPSTNTVKLTPKDCASSTCDIPLTVSPGDSVGKYSVTYTFEKEGGYQLLILPSAPGYPVTEYQDVGTITVIKGAIEKECTSTKGCPDGYTCSNYKCVSGGPSYLKYVMYGLVVLIGLIIIFIVYRVLRKPKQEVYTGIGGL